MSAPVDLPRTFKGKRPAFFDDPAIDALLVSVLELAQEVSVLRDRVDAYEQFLDTQGVASRAAFEAFTLPPEAAAAQAARREALIARLFRVVEREV